jgi:hypothetical protein
MSHDTPIDEETKDLEIRLKKENGKSICRWDS